MKGGTQDHHLVETLYQCLTSASMHTGSRLKKYPLAPYSPEIAHLRNIECLLKLTISHLKTPAQSQRQFQVGKTYS